MLSPGEKAWFAMAGGIAVYDVYAIVNSIDTMTEAWREALAHPVNKWVVIGAWVVTTKHLFFGNKLKWADPFNLIALTAMGIQKVSHQGEKVKWA